jgi:glutaredoxin
MSSLRTKRCGSAALALSALFLSLPALALYKVVGPDGKVTYTDRAPSPADGKVTPLSPSGNSLTASTDALPLELRQLTARYPVTLYVIADCAPCDGARSLLRQRGIPYAERLVATEVDAEALQRLTGGRELPALTIGQQALRGLSAETWNSYLDSAGYPRESRLPAGYAFAAATPLTERREPAPAVQAPAPARVQPEPVEPAPSAAPVTGIRF